MDSWTTILDWLSKLGDRTLSELIGIGLAVLALLMWVFYRSIHWIKNLRRAAPAAQPGSGAIPGLPQDYQPRDQDLDPLKKEILNGSRRPVGVVGASRGASRRGMGGIEKSVMAAALARDREVKKAFPQGVFWLSFGRQAREADKRSEFLRALGEPETASGNPREDRTRIAEATAGRDCLVVLDDVRTPGDAEDFTLLGGKSRLLVTTRDDDVLEKIQAQPFRLAQLSPEKSLSLLAGITRQGAETLPAEAGDLARECGRLPLALTLVGRLIRGGRLTWKGALERLRNMDIGPLAGPALEHEHPGVLAALQLSVEELSNMEKGAFLDCAVFPENVAIPESALMTLWSNRSSHPKELAHLAQQLVNRSLLQRDGPDRFRIQNLFHDYLRATCANPPALHRGLLRAYAGRCPRGWPSGPDDGYFFQRLLYPLAQAGETRTLRALLLDYDWIAARLKAGGVSAVLGDYEAAADDDEDLRLVRRTLNLSAPLLALDPDSLASDLISHLHDSGREDIDVLVAKAAQALGASPLQAEEASPPPPGGPLIQTLKGHAATVTAVAVLDSGRIISASIDNTLRLWDLKSGRIRKTLEGHLGWVTAVAALDGERAISASADKTLRIWDLTSGRILQTLEGHRGTVTSVAILDGERAISASYDNTLRLWDLEFGEALTTFHGHPDWVRAVAVLNGGRALSASDDHTLRLWDIESEETLRTLEGHAGPVRTVAVLDDHRAISGSVDNTLRVWDIESGKTLRIFEGHSHPIRAVAVLDGERAISASDDNTLMIWDLTPESPRLNPEGQAEPFRAPPPPLEWRTRRLHLRPPLRPPGCEEQGRVIPSFHGYGGTGQQSDQPRGGPVFLTCPLPGL